MKSFSQTRNRIISAVVSVPHESAGSKRHRSTTGPGTVTSGLVESAKNAAHTDANRHLAALDPSCAYGCVDWYLYPDSKRDSATTR